MIPRDRLKMISLNSTPLVVEWGSCMNERRREGYITSYPCSVACADVCAETPRALILWKVYLG
jgi:hypothetical protein